VALNLWKIGGKLTSYNPLPIGAININLTNIGDYRVIVKARSLTNGTILTLQWDDGGSQKELKSISLTTTTVEYVWDFTTDKPCPFYVIRGSGTPDIIIDSIELVQKPLPKLTLNGVDGFLSGKWSSITSQSTVIDDETLIFNSPLTFQETRLLVNVVRGQTYTFKTENSDSNGRYYITDSGSTIIANAVTVGSTLTFTPQVDAIQIRFGNYSVINTPIIFKRPMLNLGSAPAPYSRKTGDKMVLPVAKGNGVYQVNKLPKKSIVKARTGLSFNGTSDYLQLPSMTTDSVEIDCLIDSTQPTSVPYFLDARTGLANSYFRTEATGKDSWDIGWSQVLLNGIVQISNSTTFPRNQRIKIKSIATTPFADDLTIFANNGGTSRMKGTLYKVTCYLGGQIVAQYDFENPSNIVGTNVLQKGVNLIPNFDDTRWNLHANAQVLGRNMLRLNATGANQVSTFDVDVTPNTNYLGVSQQGRFAVTNMAGSIITGASYNNIGVKTFNSGNNTKLRLYLSSESATSGTFDFIKPQLYALSGNEGTLNGTPIQSNKRNKRLMYAKR
jgi:hypothetical protein